MARRTAVSVLLAGIAVIVLELIEGSWSNTIADLGLRHTDLGTALAHQIDIGTYGVLLQSVAAVTGVFLALYFTAVSTVAATVYATVPHDVRELMLRDKLGNVYVRVVAFLTAMAVFLLVAAALGAATSHLALVIVAVLSGFAIFSFITLGQRAFYFADPTVLGDTLVSEFGRWFRSATPTGWQWLTPELQEHYRQQARKSLGSLVSLIALARTREHLRGDPQRRLVMTALAVLEFYVRHSSTIPTKSRWFGQRYEHQQWYLTDSAGLGIATETYSQLSPSVLPDAGWVESQLLDPVLETVRQTLEEGRSGDAYSALEQFSGLWEAFGSQFAVEQGVSWADKVTWVVLEAALRDPGDQEADPRAIVYQLGAIDLAALLPISGELGLYGRAVDLDVDKLHSTLVNADWAAPESPYALGLPRVLVETLEDLRSGIDFELSAESLVRTPGWYVADLALNRLAWAMKEQFEAWVGYVETWYPATADRLSKGGKHEGAAAVLSRGLEAAWKLAAHIESLRGPVGKLSAVAVLDDLSRPEWDWPALANRVEQFRREILKRLAASIPELSRGDERRDVPDFFGHAIHRTGEACIETLVSNEADQFAELFGPYFLGTLSIVERLRPQVSAWSSVSTAVTWMTEPVMDLLDVSGYALMLAEFHQHPSLWDTCRKLWDHYLQAAEGQSRLAFIDGACSHHEQLFAISPRSVLRTQWQMRICQLIESLPRTASADGFSEGEVDHPSQLIRRIAPSPPMGFMYLDARDVFVARYLLGRPEAAGLTFGMPDSKLEELSEDDDTSGGADEA